MVRNAQLGTFIFGFIFLGLWGIFVAVDYFVIGMRLPYLVEDNETGWFSLGLNWLTLEPRVWSHHPSPTLNQVSGLVISFLNIDGTDKPLEQFSRITAVIQGMIAFISGLWFSWASGLVELNKRQKALLVLLIFSYPSLVYVSGHWSYHYVIGLLGLPLGITLFGVLEGKKSALVLGGTGIGLLAANFYPSLVILALFVIALSLQRHRLFIPSNLQRKSPYSKDTKAALVLLGVCAAAFSLGTYVSGLPIPDAYLNIEGQQKTSALLRIGKSIGFGVILWLIASSLVLLLSRADAFTQKFLLWTLVGFIAGNFVLLPWYFHGLGLAERMTIGLTDALHRLISTPIDYPWLLVFWFTVLSILFILLLFIFGKSKTSSQSNLNYGAIFSLCGALIIAILGAAELNGDIPGKASRIFVAAIPALTVGWVILFRSLRGTWLAVWQISLVPLSLFSIAHFYQAYSYQVAENRYEGALLDETIEAFVEKHPNGRLVCVSEEYFSRYCSTAYAYNRYRDSSRLRGISISRTKALPTWRLFDGRVIALHIAPTGYFGNWEYVEETIENRLMPLDGPLFVVTEGGDYRERLVGFLSDHRMATMPLWRWWQKESNLLDENLPTISPGDSFLAVPDRLK